LYYERFGATLHDAVTLAKEGKLEDDKEMVWRACMITEGAAYGDYRHTLYSN